MDSLDLIQTFREVARRGSFSAAARALGMSPANVSKYVAQLEVRFGVRLFQRTTRKVSLTDAGQLLFERSGALLEMIDLTQGELHERATRPSGRLTVTAPHALMLTELPQILGEFAARYPEVTLQLDITNTVVNLVEQGVDVGFRIGQILDSSLIVRRLVRLDYGVVATPGYWQQHGRPAHPRDLLEHQLLAYAHAGEAPRWQFQDHGKPLDLHVQPRVCATDPAPLRVMVRQGLGVMWSALRALDKDIAAGTLEPLLQDYSVPDIWLYVAYTQRRHNSAALQALLQYLHGHFNPQATAPAVAGTEAVTARRKPNTPE